MSKNNTLYVGIDVSAKTLDMAVMNDGKSLQTEFDNNDKGNAAIVCCLHKRSKHILICVEAT